MNGDSLYREFILEHWENPQNYGVISDADFDVIESNPLCGDTIRLTGKLTDGVVTEIAFTGEGCAISKASASLSTEEIKGKQIDEITKIKPQEILDLLNIKLTPTRTKCALLVYTVIRKAIV